MKGSLIDDTFLEEFVTLREGFFHILGFSEPQMSADYRVRGFIVYHEPRRLGNFSANKGGFSVWLKISVHCDYRPERLTENTPPESVCILFRDGSLFGVKSAVVLIGAYVTNDVNINKAYERKLGRSLIEELSEYIYMQRMNYNREVILMGDLNAYTGQHAGWDGSDAYFSTDYEEGERRSYCNAERNARGTELVRLAQLNELRVLNGLELSKFSGDPFITRPSVGCDVAPPSREEPGTVLDYVLASEAALQSFSKLTVGAGMHSSDHRPVRFVWRGGGAGADGSSADAAPRGERSGPLGWRLSGHPTDEQQRAVAEVLAPDRRLGDVCTVLERTRPSRWSRPWCEKRGWRWGSLLLCRMAKTRILGRRVLGCRCTTGGARRCGRRSASGTRCDERSTWARRSARLAATPGVHSRRRKVRANGGGAGTGSATGAT